VSKDMQLESAIAESQQVQARGRDTQAAWTAELEEARAGTFQIEARAKDALANEAASAKAALEAKHAEMQAALAATRQMETRAHETLAAEQSNLEATVARAIQDRDAALARAVEAEAKLTRTRRWRLCSLRSKTLRNAKMRCSRKLMPTWPWRLGRSIGSCSVLIQVFDGERAMTKD
jgi:hypothetical protein